MFWNVRNRFKECVINDWNWELVTTYQVIQDFPEDLIKRLQEFELVYGKEEFLRLRALDPSTQCLVMRAARMIALNKWGFNGLYRVNKSGKFNVPFGSHKKPPTLCDVENILSCSKALAGVDILQGDFEVAVSTSKSGDFVYFDPPYVPLNPTSDFTSYTSVGFGLKDQQRLAACVQDLYKRGVSVVLSNSYTPTVLELYKDFTIHEVQARRSVNSKGDGRGKIAEALVVAVPPSEARSNSMEWMVLDQEEMSL